MQITCPACATVYDVPDLAIPPGGREVRCARCGKDWRAFPDGAQAAAVGVLATVGAGADDPSPALASALTAPPSPVERRIDPKVLEILQAEAAFEQAARAASGRPAEPEALPGRMSRLRAAEQLGATLPGPEDAAVEAPASLVPARPAMPKTQLPAHPRTVLPVAVVSERARRRGFRAGFALTAGLSAAALVVYLAAARLAPHLPPRAAAVAADVEAHGAAVQTRLALWVRTALGGG